MIPPLPSSMVKATLKRALVPILLEFGYHRARLGALRDRALVVVYHRVSDRTSQDTGISAVHFERQIRYLRERMHPLPLPDLVERIRRTKPLPERAVAVTFDDGYEDTYRVASPILKRYAVPATVFVVAGFLDSSDFFWWEKIPGLLRVAPPSSLDTTCLRALSPKVEHLPRRLPLSGPRQRAHAATELIESMKNLSSSQLASALEILSDQLGVAASSIDGSRHRVMTAVQLRALAADGIAVGAHTLTHPNLATIDRPEELIHEIRSSKRILEDVIQKPVTGFAYPYGFPKHYTAAVRQAVIDAGFLFACTASPGTLGHDTALYDIPRISAPGASLPFFLWQLAKHAQWKP